MAPSSPPGRLARLADLVFRRRRLVLVAWVVGLVAAFGAAGLAGEWSADYSTPGSESRAAADLLDERFPQQSPETVDIVWHAPDGADGAGAARADRCARGAVGGARGHRPQPRHRGGAVLARRDDRGAARSPHRAPGRDPHDDRRVADRSGRTDRRPRAARRARRSGDRQRAAERDLLRDHRPGDRRAGPPDHVRVGRRGRAPAGHRAVRPGHLVGRRRTARRRHGRAGLGAGARVDARDRRGDRLRPADRHALPGRARRGPRTARCRGRERWPRPAAPC